MVGIKGVSYSVPDGQPTKLWIIEDIKTGQTFTYIIDTKQCDKSTNPIHPMNCIPRMIYFKDFHNLYLNFIRRGCNLYRFNVIRIW